jgi:hypothetical protein
VATASRQPTRRDGLTVPTVALTTAKLTPHVIATHCTAMAASHLARESWPMSPPALGSTMYRLILRADGPRSRVCVARPLSFVLKTESSPSRLIHTLRAFTINSEPKRIVHTQMCVFRYCLGEGANLQEVYRTFTHS